MAHARFVRSSWIQDVHPSTTNHVHVATPIVRLVVFAVHPWVGVPVVDRTWVVFFPYVRITSSVASFPWVQRHVPRLWLLPRAPPPFRSSTTTTFVVACLWSCWTGWSILVWFRRRDLPFLRSFALVRVRSLPPTPSCIRRHTRRNAIVVIVALRSLSLSLSLSFRGWMEWMGRQEERGERREKVEERRGEGVRE